MIFWIYKKKQKNKKQRNNPKPKQKQKQKARALLLSALLNSLFSIIYKTYDITFF